MKDNSLLVSLSAVGFAMIDLQLYLDTHPHDVAALSLYNKYVQKHHLLVAEYERTYGPLTAASAADTNSWNWVKTPWPWEPEANVEVR